MVRSVDDVRKERALRSKSEEKIKNGERGFYLPTITVGTFVGRTLVAITPIVNLLYTVFDVAPEVFGSVIRWCERVLNVPVVPKRTE